MRKLLHPAANLPLGRIMWVAGAVVLLAAVVLTVSISTLENSNRAASELAELRTFAPRAVLAASEVRRLRTDDLRLLEQVVNQAESRTNVYSVLAISSLGEETAAPLLADVRESWVAGADVARRYARGEATFDEALAGADRTEASINALVDELMARSESQARLLSVLLSLGAIVGLLGLLLAAFAFARARAGIAAARVREQRSAERVQELQVRDAVTGLPNGQIFAERLQDAFDRRAADGALAQPLAVAVINLDRFKRINESFGHRFGDRLLRDVASRIDLAVQYPHTLARRGADEFLLLLPGAGRKRAERVAQSILKALDWPFQFDEQELRSTASVGIALAPEHGETPDVLIRHAESATGIAKDEGGHRLCIYEADRGLRSEVQIALEVQLRHALDRDEFVLYYQPQVDVQTGAIVAAEALMRWNAPGRGLVPPADFIPLLEETGLIVAVGEWALRTGAEQLREWPEAVAAGFRLAMNVSARQLLDSGFVDVVRRILEETGIPGSALEIEVTETVAMRNPAVAVKVLEDLGALGVSAALDDFGTGHSSLSHLRQLPSHVLKIDRSFISGLVDNAADRMIVTGVTELAHSLGRTVVAEGVETEQQLEALREIKCELAQGFLFSKPIPAEEFGLLLQKSPRVAGRVAGSGRTPPEAGRAAA